MTQPVRAYAEDVLDRFVAKVNIAESGCWEWTGWTNGAAYGKFYAGKSEPKAYAHRWLYERVVGPIPEGLTIDHLCRNTMCVNPDHLDVVSQAVNIARGTALERAIAFQRSKTHCPAGHEYTPENTYMARNRATTARMCRACGRERMRARRIEAKTKQRETA
jgi:hypothetical protein